jgi:hypothetical protein
MLALEATALSIVSGIRAKIRSSRSGNAAVYIAAQKRRGEASSSSQALGNIFQYMRSRWVRLELHRSQGPNWRMLNLGMLFSTECNVRINLRSMAQSISDD